MTVQNIVKDVRKDGFLEGLYELHMFVERVSSRVDSGRPSHLSHSRQAQQESWSRHRARQQTSDSESM